MKNKILVCLVFCSFIISLSAFSSKPLRVLIITGGHDYRKEQFNSMFGSFAPEISYTVAELPRAYDMFSPEKRKQYDVLVFYHMWQKITPVQEKMVSECIANGKPLVVLHHSICAFDDWPEYWNILGGKYFHKETTFNGKVYQPCSYIHDIHFTANISEIKHPVTNGISDFSLFDETYKGFYVADDVTPIVTTDEPSSGPVIGWAKKYGKSKVVVLQSGHDVPTFENPEFRKLLKQAILWVKK